MDLFKAEKTYFDGSIMLSLHHCNWYHSIIQSQHQTISDTNIYHSSLQSFDCAVCCSIIVALDRSLFDFLPAQTGRLGAKFKMSPGHIQEVQEKNPTTGRLLKPRPSFRKHLSFSIVFFWVEPAPRISSNFKGYFSGGSIGSSIYSMLICQYILT